MQDSEFGTKNVLHTWNWIYSKYTVYMFCMTDVFEPPQLDCLLNQRSLGLLAPQSCMKWCTRVSEMISELHSFGTEINSQVLLLSPIAEGGDSIADISFLRMVCSIVLWKVLLLMDSTWRDHANRS